MKPRPILAALAAVALLAVGCSDRGGDGDKSEDSPATANTVAPSGDFGDLKNVCQGGNSPSSPTQGVTATEINVSTFTDIGFTKVAEFDDAAKVFADWCNAAGGINGRKIVVHMRDTQMMQVRARMSEACKEDFAVVGGRAALDAQGVNDRLSCLLPAFPAQVVQPENIASDLQVSVGGENGKYDPYQGYYQWLFEAYPDSKGKVGLLNGDSPITRVLGERTRQGVVARGGTIAYDDLYPIAGVSDWTPYAQKIKDQGIKGLQFYGQYQHLAKLEQVLSTMNYKLDWIDANSNAYTPDFIELLGKSASFQNNVVDLSGFAPLESAASNPAVQQVKDLYAKYKPGAEANFASLRAFSAWMLFAKSAASCGDQLTRKCVYEAARAEKAWTGGGLQAPIDLSTPGPLKCYNPQQATEQGWKQADFKPDTGGTYRCDAPAFEVTGGAYAKPVTLADVGKSMDDVK
ncbi:ABC transporter substrate-binding protein [Yinghuangia sp. ASG 101]|uniref:ABC transporter substrate-binding protein n=1 Tax=Yinghuangia sp. ASG 101 TaxID=2896848 RepID=UPI001E3DD38B|nr:ABC transporter substrate-binding protein [Yinghuangia sp. ASG 101]UGQ12739.1 ABC transporter substrate-binding protein [Yinghuangia sp. ASG 101]